jgi:hypothetical protein
VVSHHGQQVASSPVKDETLIASAPDARDSAATIGHGQGRRPNLRAIETKKKPRETAGLKLIGVEQMKDGLA